MHVKVVYTGGTIGMMETPAGLAPGGDVEKWLSALLDSPGEDAVLFPDEVSYEELEPLIDSSNAAPETWRALIDKLWALHDSADAFVVLHGTDTMAFTSSAAAFALSGCGGRFRAFCKPVVFTGSQLPLGADGSDAPANVLDALSAAVRETDGVWLSFGGRLLRGSRAVKASSYAFRAFDAPNGERPFPRRDDRARPVLLSAAKREARDVPKPYRRHDIAVVTMVPGITAKRMRAALSGNPEAVIVRAYGMGNIPSDEPGLAEALEAVVHAGTVVVVCSQCAQAEVSLGRYEAGDALSRIGAVGAGRMTFEAAFAKCEFLLGQGLTGEMLARAFETPLAGEF